MAERWLPVPGYEGAYEVSDHGRIRSVDRWVEWTNRWGTYVKRQYPGRLLKPHISADDGYARQRLRKRDGNPTIHSLVLTAFLGSRPDDGFDSLHANGINHDNRLSNLRWGTKTENNRDKKWQRGPLGNRSSKLSVADVGDIKRRLRTYTRGLGCALAREYDVSPTMIYSIRHGIAHIDVVTPR